MVGRLPGEGGTGGVGLDQVQRRKLQMSELESLLEIICHNSIHTSLEKC